MCTLWSTHRLTFIRFLHLLICHAIKYSVILYICCHFHYPLSSRIYFISFWFLFFFFFFFFVVNTLRYESKATTTVRRRRVLLHVFASLVFVITLYCNLVSLVCRNVDNRGTPPRVSMIALSSRFPCEYGLDVAIRYGIGRSTRTKFNRIAIETFSWDFLRQSRIGHCDKQEASKSILFWHQRCKRRYSKESAPLENSLRLSRLWFRGVI